MAETPREFHFLFGLRPQDEPLHLAHWLCLESCRQVNGPRAIHLHYRHLPHGPWWDRIAPHLTLHRVDGVPAGFDPSRYGRTQEGEWIERAGLSYAHEADFRRLEILIDRGGVYADMDTLFVEPYPDAVYAHECVMAEEAPRADAHAVLRPSLCNAVIAARPHARFLRRWLERSRSVFDGTWSRHSCDEAGRLWAELPDAVHVVPSRLFYKLGFTVPDLRSLLEADDADTRGICSLHLWAHLWWSEERTDFTRFHAGMLTEEYVRSGATTYAKLARRFMPA